MTASEKAGETDVLVIRVCLITDGEVLTIEVWDQAPGMPVLRNAGPLAESGRGLAIVDDLTSGAWGYRPAVGQRGKCVWAELPLREQAALRYVAAPCLQGVTKLPRSRCSSSTILARSASPLAKSHIPPMAAYSGSGSKGLVMPPGSHPASRIIPHVRE